MDKKGTTTSATFRILHLELLLLLVVLGLILYFSSKIKQEEAIVVDESETLQPPVTTVAIFWTKYYRNPPEEFTKIHYCGNCTLKVTTSSDYFEVASGLIFHSVDVDWDTLPPKWEKHHWILFSQEPPIRDEILRDPGKIAKFDATMRYRVDATIPMPFGRNLSLPGPLPIPLSEKSRDAPVVWIADDCHTSNRREQYVHNLMRHIKIDSYGKCLNNKQWPEGKSWEDIIKHYKFVLVFEHSNCKDYVTDEFWKAIHLGVVPIVMGAPNIDDFTPTFHSIIKTNDYNDPEQLAEHLHRLDQNDNEYQEYLDYKYNAELVKPRFHYYLEMIHTPNPWCRLCNYLHGEKNTRRLRPDLTCQNKWSILKQIRFGDSGGGGQAAAQAAGEDEE